MADNSTAILMAQRQLLSDISLSAFLPGRLQLACRQPLMLLVFVAAFVQLMPMGISQDGHHGSSIAAGVADVSADSKVAIEVVRPAGQSSNLLEDRTKPLQTLDIGFASISQATSSLPPWHCCDLVTASDATATATLVDLHVRLQI